MSRVEWWTASGNARSIAVARRLGMSRDGVLRQHSVHRGERRDIEVWSVLAEEWPTAGDTSEAVVRAELDRLMDVFVGAFTNIGGRRPDLGVIRDVFVPQGRIIANVGDEPVLYDLDGFIAPRQTMLTDGTLTEFSEWEVAERTEVFGSVAHRFSEYRKSGYHHGEWFEGHGHKTTQFLRTPAGWRMCSLAWDDAPQGEA